MLFRHGLASSAGIFSPCRQLRPFILRETFNFTRGFHASRPRLSSSQRSQPTFRALAIDESSPIQSFSTHFKKGPPIRGHILFAIGGSLTAFVLAAAATGAETELWTENLKKYSARPWLNTEPTTQDIRSAKNYVLGKSLQDGLRKLEGWVTNFPIYFKYVIIRAYVDVAQPYVDAYDGRRMCWKISMLNCAVYLAWKLRSIRPFMDRNFTHHPLRGKPFTLLTSVFSHQALFHLFFNCMALNAFGSSATNYLARAQQEGPSTLQESTAAYHFLAFFVSAGLFSGLLSHVVSARFIYPRMISKLTGLGSIKTAAQAPKPIHSFATAMATNSATQTSTIEAVSKATGIIPSLGASGAIYAALVVTALGFPDAQLALAIPPSFPIPIQTGVGALVLLDVVGIARGWRMFDHWAHLGGAAFGAMYFKYGPRWWDWLRESGEDPDAAPITDKPYAIKRSV